MELGLRGVPVQVYPGCWGFWELDGTQGHVSSGEGSLCCLQSPVDPPPACCALSSCLSWHSVQAGRGSKAVSPCGLPSPVGSWCQEWVLGAISCCWACPTLTSWKGSPGHPAEARAVRFPRKLPGLPALLRPLSSVGRTGSGSRCVGMRAGSVSSRDSPHSYATGPSADVSRAPPPLAS